MQTESTTLSVKFKAPDYTFQTIKRRSVVLLPDNFEEMDMPDKKRFARPSVITENDLCYLFSNMSLEDNALVVEKNKRTAKQQLKRNRDLILKKVNEVKNDKLIQDMFKNLSL